MDTIWRCRITPRRAPAGLDLLAAIDGEIELLPGQRAAIPCGIAIELPHGVEAQVRPRSGLALNHGVTVLNAPGTIDSDYRGEIKAILINHGDAALQDRARRQDRANGDRPPRTGRTCRESKPCPTASRGAGGFGSTGMTVKTP